MLPDIKTRKKLFLEMMGFRHACKLFEKSKNILDDDVKFILEAGRLSPSSMGMEHWKFICVQNREMLAQLEKACANQPQVGTAPLAIVIMAKTTLLTTPEYMDKVFDRQNRAGFNAQTMKDFCTQKIAKMPNLADWSIAQCHIAAANMMSAAAFIEIDSCPIGAFNQELLFQLFDIDKTNYKPALVLVFGYRAHEAQPKLRLSLTETTKFLK